MADNTQAQTLTLDNGNAAQNQYLSYYNQLISQLGGNNANTVSSGGAGKQADIFRYHQICRNTL